jgi:hypothetical protein
MHLTDEKIVKKPRRFYPEDLDINNCEVLEREMQALLDTPLPTPEALIEWMERYSELGYIIGDRMAWLYIKMTCHADDEEKEKAFNTFYADIITPLKPYDFRVLKKFYDSPRASCCQRPPTPISTASSPTTSSCSARKTCPCSSRERETGKQIRQHLRQDDRAIPG